MSRAALVLLTCLALHPVFHWTVLRALDGSDEPWNLLALGFAPLWIWRERSPAPQHVSLALPLVLVAAYAASFAWLSPLPRGMLAMAALTAVISPLYLRRRFDVGLSLVLLLSLPLMASLEFYAGYPLRRLVSEGAALLLRPSGLAVVVDGVALRLGEQAVYVDAPCSGIKMLWVGGFATGVLALVRRLRARQALLAAAGAAALLVLANVLRAAALFHAELGLVTLPPWGHAGVGLVMFAATLAAIALLVEHVAQRASHA
jgi:exosortase/archaeosortase family protein